LYVLMPVPKCSRDVAPPGLCLIYRGRGYRDSAPREQIPILTKLFQIDEPLDSVSRAATVQASSESEFKGASLPKTKPAAAESNRRSSIRQELSQLHVISW
jgi:hypothetical protein